MIKDEAEEELSVVMPELTKALKEVENLDPKVYFIKIIKIYYKKLNQIIFKNEFLINFRV